MGHQRRIARYTKGTMKATRQANRLTIANVIGTSLAGGIQRARERKYLEHETQPEQGPPPAGWYPNPGGGDGWRWWDGHRWTDGPSDAEHPAELPPPGWYADAERGQGLRWWDGERWTDYRT